MLDQVVGRVRIPKVTQAVEADTRSHAAKQFGFGQRILAEANPVHQIGVVQLNFHQHIFYV